MVAESEWETPPDADVILRASGGKEFHVHKLILSLASSVFRGMFSIPQPQPSPAESSQLPIVDVNDPPEALKIFLQFLYPTRNPLINDAETLVSVLRLADKYDVEAVFDAHREYLPSALVNSPPIHAYAVLCALGGCEKEVEAAARRISFASLASLNSHPLLRLMTTEHYQRLLAFMVARGNRTRQIVERHRAEIGMNRYYFCPSGHDDAHRLYSSIIASSLQAAFEENPCVRVIEALGIVSSAPPTFNQCDSDCRYSVRSLRRHAEGLLKELVEMAETLPWEH